MKELWESIPLFTKSVICSTLIFYLFNIFFHFVALYLANLPLYTFLHFQFWRLITASYITTSILNILFAFIAWVRDASNLEKSMGTIKYFFVFTLNTIFIQLFYSIICFILYILTKNQSYLVIGITPYGVETNGLWPIIMAEITMLCMANPDANMNIFLFPCQIKAKYYPFLLFALFTLFSGFQIQFDLLSAVFYGVFHHYVLKDKLTLTDNASKRLEGCFPFNLIKRVKGFVPVGSSQLPFAMVYANSNGGSSVQNDSVIRSADDSTSSGSSSFKAFSGKGVSVGGTLGLTKGDYEGISQNSDH